MPQRHHRDELTQTLKRAFMKKITNNENEMHFDKKFKKTFICMTCCCLIAATTLSLNAHAENYEFAFKPNTENQKLTDKNCNDMYASANGALTAVNGALEALKNGKPSRYMCLDKWKTLSFSGLLSFNPMSAIFSAIVGALLDNIAKIICKVTDSLYLNTVGKLEEIKLNATIKLPDGTLIPIESGYVGPGGSAPSKTSGSASYGATVTPISVSTVGVGPGPSVGPSQATVITNLAKDAPSIMDKVSDFVAVAIKTPQCVFGRCD